ncbi:hypothetical protein Avbf_11387 [Armadillidium vulgare]|nr:hypothetical protein Avbf_11387 [Armadillidium vulgare]
MKFSVILLLDLGQRHVNSPQKMQKVDPSQNNPCLLIIDVKENVNKWHNDFEKNQNVQEFNSQGFPGTIGALDGDPGSYHDSRVWRRSSLGHRILENENGLTPFHLIGDKTFPLNKSLIVPFRDNGHLTENQRIFNERHSTARMAIEHSFGLLKSRSFGIGEARRYK